MPGSPADQQNKQQGDEQSERRFHGIAGQNLTGTDPLDDLTGGRFADIRQLRQDEGEDNPGDPERNQRQNTGQKPALNSC